MKIATLVNAEKVVVDGIEYVADAAGLFEVPEGVGNALLGFKDLWALPYVRDAAVEAEKVANDLDPHRVAERLAAVEAKLAAVEAKLSGRAARMSKAAAAAKPAK